MDPYTKHRTCLINKKFWALFVCLFILIAGCALTRTPDTSYINQLNQDALAMRKSNPDSAFYLSRLALQQASKRNYKKGIGYAWLALGYTHLVNFTTNDSAETYLLKALHTFKKIKLTEGLGVTCFALGYVYSFKGNMTKSARYSHKSLDYYSSIGHTLGMYNASNSLSYIYKQFQQFEKSYEYIYQCIGHAKDLKDTSLIADAYNSLANIYKDQGLFKQAIEYYFNALEMWESRNDSAGMAIAYGSIGNMYFFQYNYDEALGYYHEKLNLLHNSKNHWELSKTYNSMAEIYGIIHRYDSAIKHLQMSLELNLHMNYPVGISENYYKIAKTYYLMGFHDSASVYLGKYFDIMQHTDVENNLAHAYLLKGHLEDAKNNETESLLHFIQAYKVAKKQQIPFIIAETCDALRKAYNQQGNHQLAYKYFEEYQLMKDSIRKEENIKKLARLESRYEFEKKRQQLEKEKIQAQMLYNERLRKQRAYIYLVIGIGIFFIAISLLFIKQRNIKNRLANLALEQKLLRLQMDPHFIFNSLTIVQDCILQNNQSTANRFLTNFSRLMRAILEQSIHEFIPLDKEIETLNHYLSIQKIRFDNNLTYNISVSPGIDIITTGIPPMMAQPFIENAIEHGLKPMFSNAYLQVKFAEENGLIVIEIIDNGVGREKSGKHKGEKKNSMATRLTYERIKLLNKSLHKKGLLLIEDLKSGEQSGTKVTIKVPYTFLFNGGAAIKPGDSKNIK